MGEAERARLEKELESQQVHVSSLNRQLETLQSRPRAARVEKREEVPKSKVSMLGLLQFDEDSDKTIVEQMREALRANAGRVIDLCWPRACCCGAPKNDCAYNIVFL